MNKENKWNIILHHLNDENVFVPDDNQPKESGRYLCTCVSFYDGEETGRYLEILRYDAERKYWHDIGNPYGISHNILAWTEGIDICDFDNYEKYGNILIEKSE